MTYYLRTYYQLFSAPSNYEAIVNKKYRWAVCNRLHLMDTASTTIWVLMSTIWQDLENEIQHTFN